MLVRGNIQDSKVIPSLPLTCSADDSDSFGFLESKNLSGAT